MVLYVTLLLFMFCDDLFADFSFLLQPLITIYFFHYFYHLKRFHLRSVDLLASKI